MVDTSVLDKSMRSVFVGNIPYETTEEKLKDIFSAVGPVLSFKLVFDRENGKPKGYGFCEYKDQETALSAMRNLNGYEIAGRSLRVDNACTEKSRLEMQSLLAGPPIDNTYGEPIDSEKAPEAISKAVASLPPEQMFELMKQMKLCIQNNPTEGRQMLLQNPQLAYALLQAQVVMRIVDPQVAITMLHKVNPPSNAVPTPTVPVTLPQQPPITQAMAPPLMQSGPMPSQPMMPPQPMPPQPMPPKPMDQGMPPQPRMPNHPSVMPVPGPQPLLPPQIPGQDMDLRTLNRMVPPRGVMNQPLPSMGPSPLLGGPMGGPMGPGSNVPMGPVQGGPMGPGPAGPMPQAPPIPADQDMRIIPPSPIPPPSVDLPLPVEKPVESAARDPRGIYPRDPRAVVKPAGPPVPPPQVTTPKPVFPAASAVVAAAQSPSQSTSASDQEKAALIMQVLQLSDDQIAMLPPEQRQSIIVLKEQIAKSTQQR